MEITSEQHVTSQSPNAHFTEISIFKYSSLQLTDCLEMEKDLW